MNGIHDMGGMQGYGPMDLSDDVIFHADWERRVFAMTLASIAHVGSNVDHQRFRLEQLPATTYLKGYFERWYASLLQVCVTANIIDQSMAHEVQAGQVVSQAARGHDPIPGEAMVGLARVGIPSERSVDTQANFAIGGSVRARNMHPKTHTRLPAYVRGKVGIIIAHRGAHVFPDSNAEFAGEDPQHVYAVAFDAQILWGEAANARDSVILDLWEPYLEPVE